MPKLTIQPVGKTVTVSAGSSLLSAIRSAGLSMETPCNGRGTCARCLVHLVSGDFQTDSGRHLPPDIIEEGYVLACLTRIGTPDLVVAVEGNIDDNQ